MFAQLKELLAAPSLLEKGRIPLDEGLEDKQANAVKRKKKKKNRKKKKTSDEGSPQHSRSPSPDWGRSAGAHRPSFSALTSAYRPHSAQAALPTQPSDLLRNSRYTSVPSRGIPCSSSSPMAWAQGPRQRPHTAGPSMRAAQDAAWRDISPPKYTASSLKEPELGSVPGNYQSPHWKPILTTKDVDPSRQELEHEIKETRFKHVLAVPAHVLAQSLFHPQQPSAVARAKQLAEDLRIARMDRRLVLNEKYLVEKQLSEVSRLLGGAEKIAAVLSVENRDLKDQLRQLRKAHKALAFEKEQLQRQVAQLTGSSYH